MYKTPFSCIILLSFLDLALATNASLVDISEQDPMTLVKKNTHIFSSKCILFGRDHVYLSINCIIHVYQSVTMYVALLFFVNMASVCLDRSPFFLVLRPYLMPMHLQEMLHLDQSKTSSLR